jgi:acid phosphatase family membrane protein YuiD
MLFIVPIATLIIVQIIKGVLHGLKNKFSWRDFFSPGGMPSSHTALVVSLAALIGYYDGVNRPAFALAVVLTILIIWDAGVLRQIIGKHAQIINKIIHSLPAAEGVQYVFLEERVGHKFWEIFWGFIAGLAISAIYILFLA